MNFSVVIPTGDRLDYLLEAIKSVNAQTLPPREIIVVDNGISPIQPSCLPTERAVKIKYFRGLPRFGPSQARNFGALQARHDYIAFLDDDDLWHPDYLSVISSLLSKEERPDIVIGQLVDFESYLPILNKSEKFSHKKKIIDQLMRFNPGITGSTTVISRALFLDKSGYDPHLITGEDKGLILDYLLDGHVCVRAIGAKVRFRLNTAGIRQTDYKKRLVGKIRFLIKYYKYMTPAQTLYNVAYIFKILFYR